MKLNKLLAVGGVSIGTAAITSLILKKIWTRLTNIQRDVWEHAININLLKKQVEGRSMDTHDRDEIIDILAEQSIQMDYLQRHLDKLRYMMPRNDSISDADPDDGDPEPEFD